MFRKNSESHLHTYDNERPYYIAFLNNKFSDSIRVIRRFGDRLAIIKVDDFEKFKSLGSHLNMQSASDLWKLSPASIKGFGKPGSMQKLIVTGLNFEGLLKTLQNESENVSLISINKSSNSAVIQTKAKYINQLLSLKEIIFVDRYEAPHDEISIIGYDRSFHGINTLDYNLPGANGKNIVVGVKEQNMDANDIDLLKRVLPSSIAASNTTNHATVIASIIGGAGNSFYDGRGIANAGKFFPSSFSNLFADDTSILNSNNVSLQNHSYGTVIQQFYGAEATSYDTHTWLNKNFIHIFSAGNEGDSIATDGPYANLEGYANLTGNFKTAKNVITVGAINNDGNVASQSSAGPLYDGRLAPQLVALGPNGTSDAAAVVSGTVAVMQQVYAHSNNALPLASLVKAILFNCADDIYHPGLDYKTGYGLLNSLASVEAIQQKKYFNSTLAQNQDWTKIISVPVNVAELKVTLAWTDTAAQVNNNKALVNDLDLELTDLNTNEIYKPWVLNTIPNVDSLAKPPARKRDSLNTSEQVSIQLPPSGNYQIKVHGTSIATTSSTFSVAYSIDSLNTFLFLNPQHASDVNIEEKENLNIKWRTFVADTNQTGSLSISYDHGTNWEFLSTVKIYRNQFSWKIKDTSSIAQFRMQTSFGAFLSKEFIISKVIRPKVDFICTDSFELSWNKHVYANAYKIFALTDSPYLKPISIVTDTFKIFKRVDYPELIYAVEPLLSNNLPAARSSALNIELQGVQCFYKTLNYDLLDNNIIDLILELSVADFVDSIYFEKVTANGQLQQTYGSAKVISGNLVYSQTVNDINSGLTYFRGKLKLKSGGIVYTDMVSVLTTGEHPIVFYPNPAIGNTAINFVLRQGIFSDSKLQLFDITGRLLKSYSSMPDKINTSTLPSGILIYKFLSTDGKQIDSGKLIIIKK